jgi:hypothetical protein
MPAKGRMLSTLLMALLLAASLCPPLAAKSLPETEDLLELCRTALVACKKGCDTAYAKSEYGYRCNGAVFSGANGTECDKDYEDRRQCLYECGWVKFKACRSGDPGAFETGTPSTTLARPPPNIPKLSDLPKANPEHYPACGEPMLACQEKCEEEAKAAETWINKLPIPFGRLRPPIPTQCLAECKNKLDACSARIPPKLAASSWLRFSPHHSTAILPK